MTATDELRALLDERGVEWYNIRNDGSESDYLTEWQFEDNQGKATAIEWAVGSGLTVDIYRDHLTPSQAIDATLGRGTCTMAHEDGNNTWWSCNECDADVYLPTRPIFCWNCGREVVDG